MKRANIVIEETGNPDDIDPFIVVVDGKAEVICNTRKEAEDCVEDFREKEEEAFRDEAAYRVFNPLDEQVGDHQTDFVEPRQY